MSTPLTSVPPRTERATSAYEAKPKSRPSYFKIALAAAAVVAVGGAAYDYKTHPSRWKGVTNAAGGLFGSHSEAATAESESPGGASKPASTILPSDWDGLVPVTEKEQKAIGFNFSRVLAQTDPIRLELTGRTAYDTDTITKVRPRFDTRIEKVLASIGQKIKKGDPLVELYSTDLAQAKTDYQNKYVQWQHDQKLYNLRKKLVETGAISQQLWVDTQNDEQKSRNDFSIASDKLSVFYEIPKEEIDPLTDRLNEQAADPRHFGGVINKAKMTLRSKADGYVITRDVVPGNYYESTDTLMEIAPLDHLWVWVNVFELDQDKVRKGQTIEIQFPYLAKSIQGHVDFVASEVAKDTRAVKVRAAIPNPEARLKSEMLVKAMLEIPPLPGQTIVPRVAMVAIDGGEYVFVKHARESSAKESDADRFERVTIQVAQENTDSVIVSSGLKPGQEVVTNGSLLLSQLYEDQRVMVTGTSH